MTSDQLIAELTRIGNEASASDDIRVIHAAVVLLGLCGTMYADPMAVKRFADHVAPFISMELKILASGRN